MHIGTRGHRAAPARGRAWLAAGAALLALACPLGAGAQAASFNIARGDLSSALIAFSRQSGIQVAIAADVARGRRVAAPVSGPMEPAAALRQLLGDDLRYEFVDPTSVVIGRRKISAVAPARAGLGAPLVEAAPAEPAPAVDDGEIIVTAQRRSESLTNVPLSVTALTQAQLEAAGVGGVQDLTTVTPGLVWARTTSNSQPTIRGIGSRNSSTGDEPNVATYFDGVYQPDQYGTIYELANIERIEVLKGPQVTLFGRNATGGAINIATRKPGFTPEGEVTAAYGRFNYMKGTAYLSLPIVADRLAANVSAVGLRDDGYIHNVYLDRTQGHRKLAAARAKLLFLPSESVELQLNGYYSWSNENVNFSAQPLNGNTRQRQTPPPAGMPADVYIPTGHFETATTFEPYYRARQMMIDGHFSVDLPFGTLSGLAAYQRTKGHSRSDSDLSPLPTLETEIYLNGRSTYQELLLTSDDGGRLKWIVGANGFQGRSFQDPSISGGVRTFSGQKTRSLSAFGELTWEAADKLFLTGGLRYTYDRKRSYNRPAATNLLTSARESFTNLSPRAVIRYQFDSDANVYASFTQGFKSGTFNPLTAAGARVAARPEKVDAYEVGVKARVAPGIRLNAAAFHYDYKDLQVTVINLAGTAFVSALENAPLARVDGAEFSADIRLGDALRLGVGVSYLDTRVVEFDNASVNTPVFVGGLPAGNVAVVQDVAGNDLLRAPKWTLNLDATYTVPLADGKLAINGSAYFSAKWYQELLNRVTQPAYHVVNGSISWTDPSDRFTLSVFGRNLTDQRYFATLLSSVLNDNVAYAKPRWFGVSAGYRF